MGKKLLFLTAVIMFFLLKLDTVALESTCTTDEQVRLKNLIDATQITYVLNEDPEDGTKSFTIKISGFTADFYIYNVENGTHFEYENNSVIEKPGFSPGVTYLLPFFGTSGLCKNVRISSKTVVLPTYNYFSEDPLCVGHEEYTLCKKFVDIDIDSYSDFKSLMNKYITSLNNTTEEEPEKEVVETPSILEVIGDFIAYNYMLILISIIVIGTSGIIIIEVEKRRSIL
ncbi:MAG: hypothetical protein WC343_13935 [Bacilli bacterium]|jgi:hypothetical protein